MSTETEREAWARRIKEAERIAQRKRYRPPEEKIDWLKTNCTHCGYRILYSPKPNFKGELRCPQCGKKFNVVRLDEFCKKITLDNIVSDSEEEEKK